ncbi:MAG TPA: hypothetical protein VNT22_10830 [Baekduia sp.]|nr:hypothetical protein [Baekduia sp.]
MIAKRRYDIKITRSNPASVEIVDIHDGEVVLFWDVRPKQARKMEEALRHDLVALGQEEFIARWSAIEPDEMV